MVEAAVSSPDLGNYLLDGTASHPRPKRLHGATSQKTVTIRRHDLHILRVLMNRILRRIFEPK
jgi:hypothetical protein